MASTEQAQAAPDSLDEVVGSVRDTVLVAWGDFVDHLPFLGLGLLILLLTWGAAWLGQRAAALIVGRRARASLRRLIERLLALGIWGLGLLLAAIVVFPGLSPTKALGGLGLLSVAVGFAFRDTFENFFAGMLMLWKYPFESGDFIRSGDIFGRVEQINIRMTLLRKVSGELLLVPNSKLFQNPTEVLTDRPMRRITVMTGVAYGEDLAAALTVIETAVTGCDTVIAGQPVQIFAHGFGDSSMDIEVTWWCDATPLGVRRSRSEIVVAVKAALDAAGIEIPFPYRTLTFAQPLPLIGTTPTATSGGDDPG
ncbi:mechanosensitive ion channel family protein [Endozoicomonas sp. G2_2]|uniref:mechanosensitive ion channel family protein n=1 Tax=Endozoicomonas sp. G2_2 TaxID=2821092 RepID=UPI001AD99EA1|nr:mechanosensitive ion channel family protein [Endozoicomonas sp. G2_2]MBO9468703.1 mechanosensitive ion channel family protein [Endozoicomonas sp. G2_2]|tara:strand:+ start:403 stop:1332 length:930 start_codon:yes stop_codon:yes gene_type:complete